MLSQMVAKTAAIVHGGFPNKSHFDVLQEHVHRRRSLHEREELEVAQTDVDTAELAYLVR